MRFCLKTQNGAWEAAQWIKVLHCSTSLPTQFTASVQMVERKLWFQFNCPDFHKIPFMQEWAPAWMYIHTKNEIFKKRKVSASLTSYSTTITLIFLITISCIVSIKDISNKFTLRINDQAWWYTPLVLALKMQRQVDLCVQGQLGQQIKFYHNQFRRHKFQALNYIASKFKIQIIKYFWYKTKNIFT